MFTPPSAPDVGSSLLIKIGEVITATLQWFFTIMGEGSNTYVIGMWLLACIGAMVIMWILFPNDRGRMHDALFPGSAEGRLSNIYGSGWRERDDIPLSEYDFNEYTRARREQLASDALINSMRSTGALTNKNPLNRTTSRVLRNKV